MILAALDVNLFKMLFANTPACTPTNTHTHTSHSGRPVHMPPCKYTVYSLRLFMTDLCCCASDTFQAYCGL